MGEKIFGFHAIEESLKQAPAGSTLYLCRGMGGHTSALERQAMLTGKVAVKKIASVEMDRMAPDCDHRGALLDLGGARTNTSRAKALTVKEFCQGLGEDDNTIVLVLDELTDPQNLGAILRSCDQFSVGLVIIPERRSVQVNETVIKVSSGAAQYVPISVVTNINRELEYLKANGFWVYGADMEGKVIHKTVFPKKTVLVMGSEGKGMNKLTQQLCDMLVSIPMTGHIDSLNVSVATGILLYEVRRQQATATL
ncbi:23S rRNA (guanosine(2251)-2'-O)-methyltransferase RlmB [uncultured Sphaerochaeta sp.]|uniref:23S rRNA (guanosine(2251)-2'-O)-methyltransferase RlmB n=1 Tax=uncultured Sphaerochaeta sp. TaxID=886478 RepID=UPI002A0A74A1|nr:23S rRNA (guanosine(2251)-2'-O)-methyltransferase RlmB [uncultured Sphaerochaeta sp.]